MALVADDYGWEFLQLVDLGMLVALVQLLQGFVLVVLSLAWVLLLDVAVLGLGFLRDLGVLVLRFLLGPGCSLGFVFGLVLDFHLHC